MWDLPIYMGLVGSVAYVAYKLLYRMTGKEKLSASGRWILLRLVMAFYLLPFPLLSEPLKRMIRDLSDKDILFRKVNTGVRWEDVSKTFYIGNDGYMTFGKMATWKRNILITGVVRSCCFSDLYAAFSENLPGMSQTGTPDSGAEAKE